MGSLAVGEQVADLKALSYADSEIGGTDFVPDSFVLILADNSSTTITSATDWTLTVEPGVWPLLPDWAWPPENWRYEDVDSPLGSVGYDIVRGITNLRNEVGDLSGIEIIFDSGLARFKAGDSVSFFLG
jgi:hypothetical protein